MTMVPAQNLSKQQYLLLHQYHNHKASTANYGGGCGGNIEDLYTTERFGGSSVIMSRKSTQGYDYCSATDQSSCVGSDILVVGDHHHLHQQYPLLMADDQQDESRTNSLNNDAASTNSNKELIEGTADQDHQEIRDRDDDDHEGWLQLSIGGHSTGIRHQSKTTLHNHHHEVLESTAAARRGIGGAVTGLNTTELDLLPGGGSGGGIRSMSTAMLEGPSIRTTHHHQIGRGSSTMSNFGSGTNFSATSLMYFPQHYPGSSSTSASNFPHHHQEALNNWAFRPLIPQQYYAASSSTTSSLLMPVLQPQLGSATTTSYLARQFQLHPPVVDAAVAATVGPSVDFRVVNPPQRPHSGIWFTLQASQNQAKEPFLPQISKSFLRIKDGRMTVRLLIKYLVNKLRLDSESEIEITCRGQQLPPYLTLQHVRDNIWAPTLTLLPDSCSSSSTTDHLMVLHYSRSSA